MNITNLNIPLGITISTPAEAPGAPTIGIAYNAGQTSATVAYVASSYTGGSPIIHYTATSSPGGVTAILYQAGSGTITVLGLTPSTAYTFTVTASNAVGTSVPSAASNSITTNVGGPTSIDYILIGAGGSNAGTSNYQYPGGGGGGGGVKTGTTGVSPGITYNIIVANYTGYGGQTPISSLIGTGLALYGFGGGVGGRGGNGGTSGDGGAPGGGNLQVGARGGSGGQGGQYVPSGSGGPGSGGGGGGGGGGAGGYSAPSGGFGGSGGSWSAATWQLGGGPNYGAGAVPSGSTIVSITYGIQGAVVIKYPNTYAYASSTTGSPTVLNTGGYIYYQWKTVNPYGGATGSISF